MRLSLYCGLPFLRRDLSLRRVLAVRIWRDLLFLIGCVIESREEHLCLVHVLFWSSDVCWMLSAVCYWSSIWCFWCGPDGHVVLLSLSSVGGYGLFLSFVVSEMDHGLLRSIRFGFLRWICCSLLTLFWIRQRCVTEVDLAGVVVGTFSCWSDFSMRASVKHDLCGGSWLPWWTI